MKSLNYFLLLAIFTTSPLVAQSGPYDQGERLYAGGQYKKAVFFFEKALGKGESRWRVLQALGDCWVRLKNPEKAKVFYRQSLSLHPDNPSLEYYVFNGQPAPNPLVPMALKQTPKVKKLDLSATWGLVFPFQSSVLNCKTTMPWEASFYLGASVSPLWSLGVQADYIDFGGDGLDFGTPGWIEGPPPDSNVTVDNPRLIAGEISVNGKFYVLPVEGPVFAYLLGGGGLFIAGHPPFLATKYQDGHSYYQQEPETLTAGPALNWGVGLGFGLDEDSKALLEFRGASAFAEEAIRYGSLNLGVLFIF